MDAELTSIKDNLHRALKALRLSGVAMHVSKATTANELYLLARIGIGVHINRNKFARNGSDIGYFDEIEHAESAILKRADYTLG